LLPTRFHPGTTPRQGKDVVAFAERVAKAGSADFVPVPERIAAFDNDGVRGCGTGRSSYSFEKK